MRTPYPHGVVHMRALVRTLAVVSAHLHVLQAQMHALQIHAWSHAVTYGVKLREERRARLRDEK